MVLGIFLQLDALYLLCMKKSLADMVVLSRDAENKETGKKKEYYRLSVRLYIQRIW